MTKKTKKVTGIILSALGSTGVKKSNKIQKQVKKLAKKAVKLK